MFCSTRNANAWQRLCFSFFVPV
ncbi:putative OmpU domain protein, partial [Vibrio parahaemolyticus V-223/04]